MFQQLLESNAVRRPRVGGSMVSAMAHAALVAAAVAITTQREAPAAVPEPRVRLTVVVPTPVVRPDVVHTARGGGVASQPLQNSPSPAAVLPSILDITVGIATPDLMRAVVDANDFGRRRGASGPSNDGLGGNGTTPDGSAWAVDKVDKPVVMMNGVAMPTYPPLLRSAGVAGVVLAEFVVDTLGRVEPGSLRIVQADHELFASAVREVVPRLRFIPAEVLGRKVRQLVRLPFRFDLNPDDDVSARGEWPGASGVLIRF